MKRSNKLLLKIFISLFCIAVIGCSTTGPYKKFSSIVSQLHEGMTQQEVRALLGAPTFEGYEMHWRLNKQLWVYVYRKISFWRAVYLTIYFNDKNGAVLEWKEWSQIMNL